jgi:hypothetical protein
MGCLRPVELLTGVRVCLVQLAISFPFFCDLNFLFPLVVKMDSLVGSELLIRSEIVSVSSVSSKYVILYFCSGWCPVFSQTSALLEILEKARTDTSVVYVSSDRSQEEFDKALLSISFYSIPFSRRDIKRKLTGKFRTEALPAVVVLEQTEAGVSAVCSDGYGALMRDSSRSLFPWGLEQISSVVTVSSPSDERVPLQDLFKDKEYVAFYFSASSNSRCESFDEALVRTFSTLRQRPVSLDIVFVSMDETIQSCDAHHKSLPFHWIAADADAATWLREHFCVTAIPTLSVVHSASFSTVRANAVSAVQKDHSGADFPWRPQALLRMDAEGVQSLNEGPCICAIAGALSPEVISSLTTAAEELAAKGFIARIIAGDSSDAFVSRVRDFLHVGDDLLPGFAFVDLPNAHKSQWVRGHSVDDVRKLVGDVASGDYVFLNPKDAFEAS